MTTISLRGQAINTNGDLPKTGEMAPDFRLVTAKLEDKCLSDFGGKKVLLNIVPSLDTRVCAVSTKKFNDLAAKRDDVVMLMISADLPFAQSRFCEMEKLNNVQTLSMMRSRNFAKDYGVLLVDGPLAGITARAVIVIDEQGKVIYTELVEDVANEPNYDAAIAALTE